MSTQSKLLALMCLVLIVAPAFVALAEEEEAVTLDQVPPAVKTVILQETAGAKIIEIEREIHKGQTTYEVEFLSGEEQIEIEIAPDGKILRREIEEPEQSVTIDQVPAAVKATILKETAGAAITEIEQDIRNGKTVFEVEFLSNGQQIEVTMAPDGTIVERETHEEDEASIRLDEVPEPARRALLMLASGAKIVEVEREREHDALVYEAAWIENGARHEAEVLADGTLMETEENISAGKTPEGVQAAIAKHFGNKKVTIEKRMVVIYDVEAIVDGREIELLVLPSGKIVERGEDND